MHNTNRRGFFSQLMTGFAVCIFFPFFRKEPSDKVPILLVPSESLIKKELTNKNYEKLKEINVYKYHVSSIKIPKNKNWQNKTIDIGKLSPYLDYRRI